MEDWNNSQPFTPEQNAAASEQPANPEQPYIPTAPLGEQSPGYPDGAYAYRNTQQNYAPPADVPQKKKKTRKNAWIPLAIIAALLVGIGGGAGVYKLADSLKGGGNAPTEPSSLSATQAPTAETTPQGDISTRIVTNQSSDYMAPSQIYREYVEAVVGIANEGTTTNVWGQVSATASSGTGFILSEDGYILTNYHVVEGARALTVTLYDGTEYDAQVVGYESGTCDVALLKIDATGLKTVSIGDSDVLQVGEEVCTIGNPLGELTYTLTVGYISAKGRAINTDGTPINMLQTDAAINSGNSGGPLFDINGNVIGITTAKYSGETTSGTSIEGIGFAIPINDVMDIVDDLQQYGYIKGRAYLGVTVQDAATVNGLKLPDGAYVSTVLDDYCAKRAGVAQGDVIVGLDDKLIGSLTDLSDALKTYKAGDTVRLTVYRNGSYLELSLTLDERPQDTTQEETEPTTESMDPFGGFGFQFP